jgi:hypothetical protein
MTTAAERQRAREQRARPARRLTGTWDEGDPDEKARQDAIGERMDRDLKARAAKTDRERQDIYRSGRDEARREHHERDRTRRQAKAKGKVAKGRGVTKRAVRRRTKRVATAARSPVRAAQSGTWVGVVVASLGLVLVYDFVSNAEQVGGFLGGLQRAVAWLADPNAVIEFKE